MTSRIYKTAQGQTIDLGALALKNEKVLAVSTGGGKINARGDRLDDNNNVIDSKSAQVQRQFAEQTQQIQASVNQRPTSGTNAAKEALKPKQYAQVKAPVEKVAVSEEVIVGLDDVEDAIAEPNPVKTESTTAATKELDTSNEGLAAAIARAKKKKDE